eukprot:8856129-Pyramimonas_sp.AAC.1
MTGRQFVCLSITPKAASPSDTIETLKRITWDSHGLLWEKFKTSTPKQSRPTIQCTCSVACNPEDNVEVVQLLVEHVLCSCTKSKLISSDITISSPSLADAADPEGTLDPDLEPSPRTADTAPEDETEADRLLSDASVLLTAKCTIPLLEFHNGIRDLTHEGTDVIYALWIPCCCMLTPFDRNLMYIRLLLDIYERITESHPN